MSTQDAPRYRQHRFAPPPGATDILVIRHGESQPATEHHRFPTVDGHTDPPLCDHGHVEARAVAERFVDEEISAIYVTTLQRTVQTATPLATALGIEPRVEADLREVYLGEWEGPVLRARIEQRHPLARQMFAEQRWSVIPGAEDDEALRSRIRGAITRLAAAHPDERIAVFTHGGVIGALTAMVTGGEPFAFIGADNASLTHIVIHGDRWILRRFNDTGHLPTDLDKPVEPLT